ncbi:MAG: hypothetical protein SPI86_00820 [Treponemataceae bacterium]|nr:hypothetical protein [Spirochaetales bacterium]MDY6030281.1 hypothetical protein [Treponemataceae bacterium]
MKNNPENLLNEFCEDCMFDNEKACPWYGNPRLEYVGDELDAELTDFHNVNMKDNAKSGHYQGCVYNDYLIAKMMKLTDESFDEWYSDDR